MLSYNNELKHYGVLGMKWGVRKDIENSGGIKNKGSHTYSDNRTDAEKNRSETCR